MGMPGGMELFALIAVVVLLFGGKKIPELAKGLGQGIKNFKSAVKEDEPNVEVSANSNKTETTTIESTDDVVETKTDTKTVG